MTTYAIENKNNGWRMMGRWNSAQEAQSVLESQGLSSDHFHVVEA